MRRTTLSAFCLSSLLLASTAFAADTPTTPPTKPDEHHSGDARKHGLKGDLNKDGGISRDEWNARRDAAFNEADANHDAKIDKNEMHAHREKKQADREKRKAERLARHEERGERREEFREKRGEAAGAVGEKRAERRELRKPAASTPAAAAQ